MDKLIVTLHTANRRMYCAEWSRHVNSGDILREILAGREVQVLLGRRSLSPDRWKDVTAGVLIGVLRAKERENPSLSPADLTRLIRHGSLALSSQDQPMAVDNEYKADHWPKVGENEQHREVLDGRGDIRRGAAGVATDERSDVLDPDNDGDAFRLWVRDRPDGRDPGVVVDEREGVVGSSGRDGPGANCTAGDNSILATTAASDQQPVPLPSARGT